MDQLWITGGKPLSGVVDISGSKNAALPVLAACLLTAEAVVLKNLPHLKDVSAMLELLGELGLNCSLSQTGDMTIYLGSYLNTTAPYELTAKTRASILLLGPLLARRGKVKMGLPGGCMIGSRPINLHLNGLEKMGAKITVNGNYIEASCDKGLNGAVIDLPVVSVTTTQNLIMAATLAKGTTIIQNAACEPEIIDLVYFLRLLGASIQGEGTSTIIIQGVLQLGGGEHTILPDRLEASTLLIAAACTGGKVTLDNVFPYLLENVIEKLKTAGATIKCSLQQIHLSMNSTDNICPVDIQTAPYPGFPTDMQAQFMALNTIATGVSKITETIFENRFLHVSELCRMGAHIKVIGRTAVCTGVSHLKGARIIANDLRGCASLVLAALMAQGDSVIYHADYVDRGYEFLEEKLLKLGADIQWVA